MKCIALTLSISFLTFALVAFAGEKKPLPGQAGNDDVELVGSVIIDRDEIKQALGGSDLGAGYVLARMKVTPKTEKPLRISPDDFTMVSRKDGQRATAISPGQIAGRSTLVVKAAPEQPGGLGTMTNGPIWGGIGMGRGGGGGNSKSTPSGTSEVGKVKTDEKENPLLEVLKAKVLPDADSVEPVQGLLYFTIDGKIKPKDLAIIYKGGGGRLVMEFANPK
jgi:hypothetical protein